MAYKQPYEKTPLEFKGEKGKRVVLSKKDGSFSEEIKPYIVKEKKNKAVVRVPEEKLYSQELKPYTNTTHISEDRKGNVTYTEPYPTSEALSVGDYRDAKRQNIKDNLKAGVVTGLGLLAYRSLGRGTDK